MFLVKTCSGMLFTNTCSPLLMLTLHVHVYLLRQLSMIWCPYQRSSFLWRGMKRWRAQITATVQRSVTSRWMVSAYVLLLLLVFVFILLKGKKWKDSLCLLYNFFPGFSLCQTGEQRRTPNKQLGFFHRSFSTDTKPQRVCFSVWTSGRIEWIRTDAWLPSTGVTT